MKKFNVAVFLAACLVVVLTSCNEQQIAGIDRAITDANTISSAVKLTATETPIAPMLPADYKLYIALAATAISGATNIWQKIKGDLMKKTTKAIVKGIEKTGNPDPKVSTNLVKMNISKNMKEAGIYDQGNLLVDKMKLGLI